MKLLVPAGEPGVTARPRPDAGHAAMAASASWLVLFGVIDATAGVIVISLFSVAPLIAAAVVDERRTAVFAGATVALTLGAGWWHGIAAQANYEPGLRRSAPSAPWRVVVAGMRRRREERSARMTAIEQVAGEVSRAIGPHPGEEDFITAAPANRPLRRAGHCQLRSSPAAAGPLRRPAAADRQGYPAVRP
jgi:hypothetical protein